MVARRVGFSGPESAQVDVTQARNDQCASGGLSLAPTLASGVPGYRQHAARWKQKCLAHLRRTAGDWKAVVGARPLARQFFEAVKAWAQRGCEFHRQRRKGLLTRRQSMAEKRWLREELARLSHRVTSGLCVGKVSSSSHHPQPTAEDRQARCPTRQSAPSSGPRRAKAAPTPVPRAGGDGRTRSNR
jgi:hypothetical protein